jgi:hypothetical protein
MTKLVTATAVLQLLIAASSTWIELSRPSFRSSPGATAAAA